MTEQTALDDPLKSDNFPEREFYTAAEDGDVDTVCTLLLRLPGYPNNMDEAPFKIFVAALTWAAEKGHVGVTAVMLEGLDTGDQVLTAVTARGRIGWSAMALAAENGHANVMTVMLERLDAAQVLTAVTEPNAIGFSAMTWAAANGHANVMTVMLAELDTGDQVLTAVTKPNGNGGSALTWAAEYGHADMMMAMVTMAQEKGAGAAQIAEMFLKRDERNENAIEQMDQRTLAAVWEKLPKDVQGQLIADDRFPLEISIPAETLRTAFAEVAARNAVLEEKNKALEEENEALKAAIAATQGKPPAGNAGQGTSDSPKPK